MNGNALGALGELVRDWTPFVALVTAGLVWGMKLEARYDVLEARITHQQAAIARLEAHVETGILPLAAEKITVLQERQRDLTERTKIIEDRIERLHP